MDKGVLGFSFFTLFTKTVEFERAVLVLRAGAIWINSVETIVHWNMIKERIIRYEL